ncbi:M36 family metallopeptidase, partial [Bacteroidia bacterium]|nr:M36 family metallopeptidase [Bacteroidia bacterium]
AVSVSLYDSSNISASTFDSDFDNGIISHEYGHGISTRLTGGAASSSCLTNEEQMGEGWSDFFALVMTHESNDEASDSRGIGTYAGNEPVTGGGIRPFPYSTDLSISPYSYDDIKTFSVPHGVGSVWCSMLWDLYWSMISKHGYDSNIYTGTGGNNMAMKLVIEGLKLQKCNPGFEDGRDAIILADKQLNNGSNELLIWQVFAARGLGYNASQGNADSRSDGSEDYSIPPYLNKDLLVSKRAPSSINNDEKYSYTIVANNKTPNTIDNIEIKDTLNSYLKLVGSSLSSNASIDGQVLTWTADSLSPGDSLVCSFDVIPSFDRVTEVSWTDSVENGNGTWSANAASGNNGWQIVTTNKNSGLSSWFVPNDATVSDYSLARSFDLRDINNPILSFYHLINSESTWDGGVIELKAENGIWVDLENYFIKNGYNSVIQTNQSSAISDRAAFSGNSINFIESRLDLSSFKNSTVDIRFRFASDGAASETGWYIDDLVLEDAITANNSVTATYGQNNQKQAMVSTVIRGETIDNVSISEFDEMSKVQIYPNPAEEYITIQVLGSSDFSYSVTTIDGKLIKNGRSGNQIRIPVKGYSKGLYLISVTQNRITTYYKLIIK